jgi:hypothetical protein
VTTSRGQAANAARQLGSGLVVEARFDGRVAAGSVANLGFRYPPMTVVVRAIHVACGPSAAPRWRLTASAEVGTLRRRIDPRPSRLRDRGVAAASAIGHAAVTWPCERLLE